MRTVTAFSPNTSVVIAVIDASTLRVRSAAAGHPAGATVSALPGRGVAATLTYDALGRNVRTDSPDGTFASTEWTPWEQTVFDACDNVVGSAWEARHAAGSAHEAAAALASAAHANTPTVMLLDSLSRPYAVGTQSGPSGTTDLEAGLLYELSGFDSEGNVHRIQDRRSYLGALVEDDTGRTPPLAGSLDAPEASDAFVHKYDLTGPELHSWGMDNGTRWSLPDATGAPAQSWKGEATAGEHWFMMRPEYDVLRRPTKLWETVDWESSSPPEPKCRVLTIYGEELSNPADDNYLGRMFAQYDSGGATIAQGYGLQGNPAGVKRSLALFTANKDDSSAGVLAADPDYTTASAITTAFSDLDTSARLQLESESFVSEVSYDALGRVVVLKAPASDPSLRAVQTYGYGKSGALSSIDVKDRTGQTHQILKYVEHNARGQRTRLERGNGVSSTFGYDPHSFRVTSTRAKKDAGPTVQELQYTYDAAGNVLRIKDAAQQNVYFSNTVVEPVQTFVVDALYRLVEATGREHAPVFGLDPSVLPGPSLGLPSDDALQTYAREYAYDAAGNMLKLDVQGGWTRNLTVAADSNRLVEVAHGDDPTTLIALAGDQFGNMLGVPNVDVMRWDRAGNLRFSQSASGSNQRVWYQYGADNQRVRKVVEVRTNGSSNWRLDRETLYLGEQEYYRSYDGSGVLEYERETVHAMDGDRREAMLECVVLDGGVVPTSVVVSVRYVLSDHLRSAGVELDEGGTVISYETFHPYGTTAYYSIAAGSGYAAKRYRYSGKERDAETGLDYYGYRYLCSWIAKWVSPDPAGTIDGTNLYGVVGSNPASDHDLDGRFRRRRRRAARSIGQNSALGVATTARAVSTRISTLAPNRDSVVATRPPVSQSTTEVSELEPVQQPAPHAPIEVLSELTSRQRAGVSNNFQPLWNDVAEGARRAGLRSPIQLIVTPDLAVASEQTVQELDAALVDNVADSSDVLELITPGVGAAATESSIVAQIDGIYEPPRPGVSSARSERIGSGVSAGAIGLIIHEILHVYVNQEGLPHPEDDHHALTSVVQALLDIWSEGQETMPSLRELEARANSIAGLQSPQGTEDEVGLILNAIYNDLEENWNEHANDRIDFLEGTFGIAFRQLESGRRQ